MIVIYNKCSPLASSLMKRLVISFSSSNESASWEEKQKEVLDSIHYAKRIQQALLPNEKYINKYIK